MCQQQKPWKTKDIHRLMGRENGFVQVSWYFYQPFWVITISSYQRRRKGSSSCQTFLRNSITHQCLLFRCKDQQGSVTRPVLWRETSPGNLVGGTPFLFVQRLVNQCGAKAIWARAQFNGARALQQGGQGRTWGQKSGAIKHATTGRPRRTPVGWTLCWESICIRTNHGSSLGTSLSFA